ncbi:amino acid permease [Ktedonospora formicarum]|uniref:Amino acid permease n=2 Tax=Ktedonospora formicarum TaxID=2778364 RepID=A0A8J3I4D5_9CHLR|nr:amino acid permease [Ktedonospora formicarum]
MLCIAAIAPAASMLFNVPVIASQAGAASPLVFVLSAIGVLLLGISVVYFARRLSSAGGFCTWIRHALGKEAAFQVGWLLLGSYALFEAALQATVGGSLENAFSSLGFSLPGGWVMYALLLTLIVGVLAHFDVKLSLWVMAPFALLEVLVLLVLDGAILLKGGASGHDLLHTFTPAGSTLAGIVPGGILGIGIGMVLGILAFVGFETAAAYGEETRHPRRAIPVAMYSLLIGLTVLYVVTSYAATIGVGWQHAGGTLGNIATAPQQYLVLANHYVGSWLGTALVILVVTSNAASAFAMHQVMARYVFSMGREQVLPALFGRAHPRWRSPYIAGWTQTGFTGLVIIFLGFIVQKSNVDGTVSYALGLPHGAFTQTSGIGSFQWLASVVTMCLLLVYILTNVAVPFFARRQQEFRVVPHMIVPLASTLLLLLPFASYVLPPLPLIGGWFTALGFAPTPFPTNILPFFVVLWIILGLGYAWYLSRHSPERYEQIGLILQHEGAEEAISAKETKDQTQEE